MIHSQAIREELLQNGFSEATHAPRHFYKELMPQVALIVNLGHEDEWCTEIIYGCASTAFTSMKNNGDALLCEGVDSDAITVRKRVFIGVDEDTTALDHEIRQMYRRFASVGKDELLAEAKELRKAFIAKFAAPLKQLGLKKKGNAWTLPDGRRIFDLQKSMYSDKYYFNLGPTRLGIPGYTEPFDWQLIDDAVFDRFIEECLLKEIRSLLKNRTR